MPIDSQTPNKSNVELSYNFNLNSPLSANFQEEEQKRLLKWLNFTKNNLSLGFDNLGTSYLPIMSNEKKGYVLNFEKIIGWRIQKKILMNLLKKQEVQNSLNPSNDKKSEKIIKDSEVYNNYEFKFSLSLSMLHLNSHSFFGSTWMGPSLTLPSEKVDNVMDFEYQDVIYMISRITDPSCVGIVEIVLSIYDKAKGISIGQYGCGWSMINFFSKPLPPDVTYAKEDTAILSSAVYYGSPRDILLNRDISTLHKILKPIPDCNIFYRLYTHKKLLRAQKYLSENQSVGRYDHVAGLLAQPIILPNTTRQQLVSCLGDEEYLDPVLEKVRILPVRRPKLVLPLVIKLSNLQLYLPKRDALEIKLIETVYDEIVKKETQSGDRKSMKLTKKEDVLILKRSLKLGLHNGHTIVSGDYTEYLLEEEKRDRDILLTKTPVAIVHGYVPDPFMALVFIIEYQIGVKQIRNTHFDARSIIDNSILSNTDYRSVTSTLVLGAGVFLPCDGNKIILCNTDKQNRNSNEVDVEIKILRDETCSILSPQLIMSDSNSNNNILNDFFNMSLTKSTSKFNVIKQKSRLSYLKSSQVGFGRHEDEEDDIPLLGFDINVTHHKYGQIRNMDTIKELLEIEDKDPYLTEEKEKLDDMIQYEPKSESKLAESSSEDEKEEEKKRVTKFKARNSLTNSYERDKKIDISDQEDDRISESIVFGDNFKSVLKLDPYFYSKKQEEIDETTSSIFDNSAEFNLEPKPEQSKLFFHSMNAKLNVKHAEQPKSSEVLDAYQPSLTNVAKKTVIPLKGNDFFVRELTRGAKARLTRHGIQDVIGTNPYNIPSEVAEMATTSQLVGPKGTSITPTYGLNLDLDIYDKLSMHEINIQFAGFRAKINNDLNSKISTNSIESPRSIYFTFQFYTTAPTRTEIMRLLPSEPGEIQVLVRDDLEVRNEASLILRYKIDTSSVSPLESHEFVNYLATKSLYIDVWDGDSLIQMGTIAFPLRKLLRQGKDMVKHAIECDVIHSESILPHQGGVTSMVIVDNGPIMGEVCGSVSLVVSNYGYKGNGPYQWHEHHYEAQREKQKEKFNSSQIPYIKPMVPIEGLNWRVHNNPSNQLPSSRPRNIVRAKPLTESSPELSRALVNLREGLDSQGKGAVASFKSLTANRGSGGTSTLTYDEVVILFKRFQGTVRGTVQYAGPLLNLMEIPSLNIVKKKLIRAFKSFADPSAFRAELARFSNANQELQAGDLEEFFRYLFDKLNIKSKPEERILLATYLIKLNNEDIEKNYNEETRSPSFISVKKVISYCWEESDRYDWVKVHQRIKLSLQKAQLEGQDPLELVLEYDDRDTHYISTRKFKDFLVKLSQYGKIYESDMTLCCRYFARRGKNIDNINDDSLLNRDPISLKEFFSAFNLNYVGNLEARLRLSIVDIKDKIDIDTIYSRLETISSKEEISSNRFNLHSVELLFNSLTINNTLSSDQIRSVLKKNDVKNTGTLSFPQILTILGISFKLSDLPTEKKKKSYYKEEKKSVPVTAEYLLNLLLTKVKENGADIDLVFRHFDSNGDGVISRIELVQGLEKLKIFENVPNWKKQIPSIIKKFDTSGDGLLNLKEFFSYLGISSYSPNIIQRLTKIFSIATEQGVSFQDIFNELDENKNGTLDSQEIFLGLKKLGTFGSVTMEDCEAIIDEFKNEDKGESKSKSDKNEVNLKKFINFFSTRVNENKILKRNKNAIKISKRFKEILKILKKKGKNIKEIFNHIDKNKDGRFSLEELSSAIKIMPNFSQLSEDDINDLLTTIDGDKSGDITLEELESFVNDDEEDEEVVGKKITSEDEDEYDIIDHIHEVFHAAESKGLDGDKLFNIADKNNGGSLSLIELEQLLKNIPSFKNINKKDVKRVFDYIDSDNSGQITISEFKDFIRNKTKPHVSEKKTEIKSNDVKGDSSSYAQKKSKLDDSVQMDEWHDIFKRLMRRISEIDGSIRSMLAFYDDDEDGLIDRKRFEGLLKREGVYDRIPTKIVDTILTPYLTNNATAIQVVPFLFYLENKKNHNNFYIAKEKKDRQEEELEDEELIANANKESVYLFSNNPEILAVEKKMRALGRILAKKGVDVEKCFQEYDERLTGCVSRVDFIKIISSLGMYLLEEGKVLRDNDINNYEDNIKLLQEYQIRRLKGAQVQSNINNLSLFASNAPKLARKMFQYDQPNLQNNEFKNHLESMTLINWYRQGQKSNLLQNVLSHSLSHHIKLFPHFGTTLFFEYPITNPFNYEERFVINVNDLELKIVANSNEWNYLRKNVMPCVGEINKVSLIENDIFDRDGDGNISVTLLPQETLAIPFTLTRLLPYIPSTRSSNLALVKKSSEERKSSDDDEIAQRVITVKIISGSHGHIISILNCHLYPRSFVINRTLRFNEYENTIAKRRITLSQISSTNAPYPITENSFSINSKFIHCVESLAPQGNSSSLVSGESSRVVVEWGANLVGENTDDYDDLYSSLHMLIRYRCGEAPSVGTFYLLIYDDPYQIKLHEIWQVVVHSRLRLDIQGTVGTISNTDLVVKGDNTVRRASVFSTTYSPDVSLTFKPKNNFQLIPGAFNRVMLSVQPKTVGFRRSLINLVDVDTKELLSAWLLSVQASAPAVMRTYDVEVGINRPVYKKILFKNPWDISRKFILVSSDDDWMRPRSPNVEVGPLGSAYLRLYFPGWPTSLAPNTSEVKEVHLFLNDAIEGLNEECHLFRIRFSNSSD